MSERESPRNSSHCNITREQIIQKAFVCKWCYEYHWPFILSTFFCSFYILHFKSFSRLASPIWPNWIFFYVDAIYALVLCSLRSYRSYFCGQTPSQFIHTAWIETNRRQQTHIFLYIKFRYLFRFCSAPGLYSVYFDDGIESVRATKCCRVHFTHQTGIHIENLTLTKLSNYVHIFVMDAARYRFAYHLMWWWWWWYA